MKTINEYLLSKSKKAQNIINNDEYVIAVLINLHKENLDKMIAEYGERIIGDGKKFPWVILTNQEIEAFEEEHDCVLCEIPEQYETLEQLRKAYGTVQLKRIGNTRENFT